MMELKRILDRATALLLQGAYQGAESFIEQAMAETDKLKSELAELYTLRTRVTEMAAEVEVLQSVIDEDNAQEPDAVESNNGSVMAKHDFADIDAFLRSCRNNTPLYKRPIPEQQSPAVAVPETISDQLENFICYLIDKEEGAIIAEETLHHQLAAFLSNEKYNKPSPRITEQDSREIITDWNSYISDDNFIPDFEWNAPDWKKRLRALLDKLNGDYNGK